MKIFNNQWITYIIRCNDDTLYTGVTNNIIRRIRQHKGQIIGGAKYTKIKGFKTIEYIEFHFNKSVASKREYIIKKFSRTKKIKMIKEMKNNNYIRRLKKI